jgi:hypothetical protein
LGDGRFRNEKGSRDLIRRQAAEETESEGDSRLGRENGMTGDKNKAEEVVPHAVVDSVEFTLRYLVLGAQ